jgi:iron(III) transport system ATP-binding protein
VSYPLEIKGRKEDAIRKRVMEVLDHLNLASLRDRFPAQLSGGQQQRVALARSLAPEPAVLLFDEPLSNLDAKLRERLREELRAILKEIGITSIYVTHDQAEAMAISDQIALMHEGRIVQKGEPEDLYERPINRFVADFVGKGNFMEGKVLDSHGLVTRVALKGLGEIVCSQQVQQSGDLLVLWRPEYVDIHPGFTLGEGEENHWQGRIVRRTYGGNYTNYIVEVDGVTVQVQTVKAGFEKGQLVTLSVDPAKVICIQSH